MSNSNNVSTCEREQLTNWAARAAKAQVMQCPINSSNKKRTTRQAMPLLLCSSSSICLFSSRSVLLPLRLFRCIILIPFIPFKHVISSIKRHVLIMFGKREEKYKKKCFYRYTRLLYTRLQLIFFVKIDFKKVLKRDRLLIDYLLKFGWDKVVSSKPFSGINSKHPSRD